MRHILLTITAGASVMFNAAHAGYMPTPVTQSPVAESFNATSAISDPKLYGRNHDHSLWAPFFRQFSYSHYTDQKIGPDFDFDPAGLFVIREDGSASLSGHLVSQFDDQFRAKVDLTFRLRDDAGAYGAKKELKKKAYTHHGGPIDTNLFRFFDLEGGTFTGKSALDGLNLSFSQRPSNGLYPLQIGEGANGKNGNLGLSVWFFLHVADNCTAKACYALADQSLYGDFNLDLVETPLPAGAILLMTGMAGLLSARRLKKSAV